MNVAVLIADPEAWYEWAGKNNVDPLIISFVQHNPDEHFYVKPDPDADDLTQSVTPRSIVSFDRQLKKMKTKLSVEKKEAKRRGVQYQPSFNLLDEMYAAAVQTLGYDWAIKFRTFFKETSGINIDEHAANPDSVRNKKADYLIGMQHKIARHIVQHSDKTITPDDLTAADYKTIHDVDFGPAIEFEKIAKILLAVPREHVTPMLSRIKSLNNDAYVQFNRWLHMGAMDPDVALAIRGYVDSDEFEKDEDGLPELEPTSDSLLGKVREVVMYSKEYGK